eukprot:7767251-Karenia_brevis.AAC.1
MRLFISVEKTKLMIFHAKNDSTVCYNNGSVYVNGNKVTIAVYGLQVEAVTNFKYLGVTLSSDGGCKEHVTA